MHTKHFTYLIFPTTLCLLLTACSNSTTSSSAFNKIDHQTTSLPDSISSEPVATSSTSSSIQIDLTKDSASSTTATDTIYPDTLLNFLDGLKKHDIQTISTTMGLWDTTYSFLNDVTIDSYSIQSLESPLDQRFLSSKQYVITLSISQSNVSLLPVGISRWLIALPGNTSDIGLFIPYDQIITESTPNYPNLSANFANYCDLYDIATTFSLATNIFDTQEKSLESIPVTYNILHHLLHAAPSENHMTLTINDFKNYITSHYHLNVTDTIFQDYIEHLKESGLIDLQKPDIINISKCGHGSSWYTCTIDSIKTSPNHDIILEIQYYSDTCFFYPCQKVAYTFKPSGDDQWKLFDVETLNDTHYLPLKSGI